MTRTTASSHSSLPADPQAVAGFYRSCGRVACFAAAGLFAGACALEHTERVSRFGGIGRLCVRTR
jgi:hypothetical protein